jgi:AcrR family transcriptional regulator
MSRPALTAERILEAAEEILRRFGPDKATVLDVARALGVSHGSVYRHFPTKAALRDAVTRHWLERVSAPLEAVAAGAAPPAQRLRDWLWRLSDTKRTMAREDPELFATYRRLAGGARNVVDSHEATLAGQLARIIADGVACGEFTVHDPARAGWAVFRATARFHHPAHAAEWTDPEMDAAFEDVCALVLRGLGPAGHPM